MMSSLSLAVPKGPRQQTTEGIAADILCRKQFSQLTTLLKYHLDRSLRKDTRLGIQQDEDDQKPARS
ncbi:hypothetical protein [Hymenobacter cellulosivorans]|uniref:Uncharacterized protein n=1 Tax=Hymenobacter cellulosivorans TaxID=2932249 RepID=A0ABY4FFI2_9BACT|nr:hypothetical protein [Hymenobacter cellulosivorans]UOQ54768.1 hypothetical protein MUN80_08410 [Hymenobacter cellulosivorans]